MEATNAVVHEILSKARSLGLCPFQRQGRWYMRIAVTPDMAVTLTPSEGLTDEQSVLWLNHRFARVDVVHVNAKTGPPERFRHFETVAGKIIRARWGGQTVDWNDDDQSLVTHFFGLVPLKPNRQVTITLHEGHEAVVRGSVSEAMWVLRRQDGRVYQLHPGYAHGFARECMRELLRREGEEALAYEQRKKRG